MQGGGSFFCDVVFSSHPNFVFPVNNSSIQQLWRGVDVRTWLNYHIDLICEGSAALVVKKRGLQAPEYAHPVEQHLPPGVDFSIVSGCTGEGAFRGSRLRPPDVAVFYLPVFKQPSISSSSGMRLPLYSCRGWYLTPVSRGSSRSADISNIVCGGCGRAACDENT